ncbi:uncharacterized protein BKA78DRAFT_157844 [Phyllosticta capitalensis]|uniref:uncharacterized protein n=1 Tax=Phyllosticta capitalensis TaxID=121624 RepID=UPI00312E0B5A
MTSAMRASRSSIRPRWTPCEGPTFSSSPTPVHRLLIVLLCSMLHILRPARRLRHVHPILRRSPHRPRALTTPSPRSPKPSAKDAQDSQRLSLSRPSLGYLIVEISRTDWSATLRTLRQELRSMPGQQAALRRVFWIAALPTAGIAMAVALLAGSWTQTNKDEEEG